MSGNPKGSKRAKVQQRYRDEYSKTWPCITKSKVSENHVFCTVCSCDFSVAHAGRDDCRRHIQSKKHADYGKLKAQSKPLGSFFTKNNEISVINAELLFTTFVVEHNLPIASTDHAGPLFRAMFPDSDIAKKYGCARTKTGALIQNMASSTQQVIVSALQKKSFSLATDGSTDSGDHKLYPLVVSYFDEAKGKICSLLLTMLESRDNTGEGIFKNINDEFSKRNIPWKNCLSFACDNANTMVGHIKGVAAFLKEVQPSIVVQGCACHLIHLAAKKATAALQEINVEQFLVQLYYYLDKSSKRKNSLSLCQAVCGVKAHKILKHVSTRWLSLLDAVNRVLEQWEALQQFFGENEENVQLTDQIKDPMLKLYCLFLSNALPVFTSVNVFFQCEEPAIHLLHRKLISLFTDLLVRFVKPSALSKASTSITDVNFASMKYQKEDCDLVIGGAARAYIKSSRFSSTQLSKFYSSVRNFYGVACAYILKKFPMQSELLKHAVVADISMRKKASYASIEYMVSSFPNVLNSEEVSKLDAEFAAYQFDSINEAAYSRADVAWDAISKMKDSSGLPKYSALSKLMLAILTIPHSNSSTERLFSIVRKNRTEYRPTISTKTLSALLVQKTEAFSSGEECYKKTFSEKEYTTAKQATRESLCQQ